MVFVLKSMESLWKPLYIFGPRTKNFAAYSQTQLEGISSVVKMSEEKFLHIARCIQMRFVLKRVIESNVRVDAFTDFA